YIVYTCTPLAHLHSLPTRRSSDPDGPRPYGIADGGVIIHEIGTARMGSNPKTSVLNKYCQTHDVKNLFVTDGAAFVTNADKNPRSEEHTSELQSHLNIVCRLNFDI